MEEEEVKIRKIITTIENEKKSYSIDVDESTTFYDFKKILSGAAHLLKNTFSLYHEGQEYTNEYDDNTIKEIFPDLETINLKIKTNNDIYEYEDELISVKLNINIPCEKHIGKFKLLYCFTCKKSICTDCLNLKQEHTTHHIEEKADYLAPAQLLMNNIFKNANIYKPDLKFSKYIDCVNFRSNLKNNIFDNLKKLMNDLEIKFNSCLEYFSSSEDMTEKNTNNNINLLKQYCIEYFIKLKNDIRTKEIIIDDEIFLTIYQKLKEIDKYKNEYLGKNKKKYEKLNTLLLPFISQIETISNDLKNKFELLLNKDIYKNFKNDIQENTVELIQKEQINNMIFNNISVERKSINRSTIGAMTTHRKEEKNDFISPEKISEKMDKNPFKRPKDSEKYNSEKYEKLSEYKSNSSFNLKSEKPNNLKKFYSSGKCSQNPEEKEITIEKKNLSIENINNAIKNINNNDLNSFNQHNKNITGETSGINENVGMTINNNDNYSHNININLDANMNSNNNTNDNIIIPIKTVAHTLIQKKNISNITSSLIDNKINTTFISNKDNVDQNNKVDKNISDDNNRNYSHDNELTQKNEHNMIEQSQTQQIENQNLENEQSSKTPFTGDLISVLNDEMSKNQQNNNNNQVDQKESIFDDNGEIINEIKNIEKSQYTPNTNINQNLEQAPIILPKPIFLFFYPITNTNTILAALEGEITGKLQVDFDQAFNKQDIQIKEFIPGLSYCNLGQYLYITGGQEVQKDTGKLFLRISVNNNNNKTKMVKMPMMNFSHWNHSMISNKDYIFVIGGYNSNKCEFFVFKTLTWEKMFDLNIEERQRAMLVIYKDYLYCFMGYTQFKILDSVERINITNNLSTNKWENIIISNEFNLNLKFYGSGIFNYGDELFFIGGKIGLGNNENDYKSEIYNFSFKNMKFNNCEICFSEKLNFIENQFHHCNDDSVGNFICLNDGCLATISISSLIK